MYVCMYVCMYVTVQVDCSVGLEELPSPVDQAGGET